MESVSVYVTHNNVGRDRRIMLASIALSKIGETKHKALWSIIGYRS